MYIGANTLAPPMATRCDPHRDENAAELAAPVANGSHKK